MHPDPSTLRGKCTQFTHTITSHRQELDLHAYTQGQGWDGTSKVEVTGSNNWAGANLPSHGDAGGSSGIRAEEARGV